MMGGSMTSIPRPRQMPCAERVALSQRIAKAVEVISAAEAEHTRAVKEKRDAAPYAAALRHARKKKGILAYALDLHRNQHGC